LDHQKYLGTDAARDRPRKSRIIKRGVPVVVGRWRPRPPPRSNRWPPARLDAEVNPSSPSDVEVFALGLRGGHQRATPRSAVRILHVLDARGIAVSPQAIEAVLAQPQWPGRLDVRRFADGRELLLDAAHNPAGAASLGVLPDADGAPGRSYSPPCATKRSRTCLGVLPVVSRLVVRARRTRARQTGAPGGDRAAVDRVCRSTSNR